MWLVLIEWDGAQPPTTYYTSLHNLTLRVRGNKEFEPIVRRAGDYNKAVIVQEGAVLVPSESLAKQVAYLAQKEGARSVMIGNVDLREDENRQLTANELEVIRRFNATFKKRGRPAFGEQEERDWVVTCPECVHTSMVTARRVMQCPRCGGLRVSAHVGQRIQTRRPTNFQEWEYSRFHSGEFEIPVYDQSKPIPSRDRESLEMQDMTILKKMFSQDWARASTDYELLDMVYCARRYYDVADRQRARVECCLQMYERGFTQNDISIFENDYIYEPIDAAICCMGYYDDIISYYRTKKGGA